MESQLVPLCGIGFFYVTFYVPYCVYVLLLFFEPSRFAGQVAAQLVPSHRDRHNLSRIEG